MCDKKNGRRLRADLGRLFWLIGGDGGRLLMTFWMWRLLGEELVRILDVVVEKVEDEGSMTDYWGKSTVITREVK